MAYRSIDLYAKVPINLDDTKFILRELINVIRFNFYIPMYGPGYFVCKRHFTRDSKNDFTFPFDMAKKQAIQLFKERKVRTVWDDEQEKWYFSIVDVVTVFQ